MESKLMTKPPEYYERMKQQHPEIMKQYEALGEAVRNAGPLDARATALVRLAMSLTSGLEGATHSAVRKALLAGCKPDEVRHVAVLAVTTIGFPAMMRARAWVEDVLAE